MAPKYWASAQRWVTNFSPYDFEGPIVGLTSDGKGGVWFGSGSTIEHIEGSGHIFQAVTDSYLWQVWSLARDPSGRIWFSLGQSGRIGTLDASGTIKTSVIVPRVFFPDIRTIAFARDGTLWFEDLGRRSIGFRKPSGFTKEIPWPANSSSLGQNFAYCQGRAWIAGSDSLFVLDARLQGSMRVFNWNPGYSTIACDMLGNLWYTHEPYQAYGDAGFIDAAHRVHRVLHGVNVHQVYAAEDGSAWIELTAPEGRVALRHQRGARTLSMWILPMQGGLWYKGTLASTSNGMVWLGQYSPFSIVRLSPSH